jgi:hypothetical protein
MNDVTPEATLMCRIHSNGGEPIKTKLATDFPLLTRRQRRAAFRAAVKQVKHQQA